MPATDSGVTQPEQGFIDRLFNRPRTPYIPPVDEHLKKSPANSETGPPSPLLSPNFSREPVPDYILPLSPSPPSSAATPQPQVTVVDKAAASKSVPDGPNLQERKEAVHRWLDQGLEDANKLEDSVKRQSKKYKELMEKIKRERELREQRDELRARNRQRRFDIGERKRDLELLAQRQERVQSALKAIESDTNPTLIEPKPRHINSSSPTIGLESAAMRIKEPTIGPMASPQTMPLISSGRQVGVSVSPHTVPKKTFLVLPTDYLSRQDSPVEIPIHTPPAPTQTAIRENELRSIPTPLQGKRRRVRFLRTSKDNSPQSSGEDTGAGAAGLSTSIVGRSGTSTTEEGGAPEQGGATERSGGAAGDADSSNESKSDKLIDYTDRGHHAEVYLWVGGGKGISGATQRIELANEFLSLHNKLPEWPKGDMRRTKVNLLICGMEILRFRGRLSWRMRESLVDGDARLVGSARQGEQELIGV